jgi:hypothetical protein
LIKQWLNKLEGSKWSDKGELWLDPEGNVADKYVRESAITSGAINYTWSYENETQEGSFTLNDNGTVWTDSWQSKLSEGPDGSLVLQMTNITPWGEDGRAE